MTNTYRTNIIIWSRQGHTPITQRSGGYCDELVNTWIACADPADAAAKALEIKKATKHAYACHYNMPEYPNHNTRSGFCHYG